MIIDTEINGVLLKNFNAHLLEYEIGECSYENGYLSPLNSLFPIKTKEKIGLRSVDLKIDFEGESKREILINISKLTSILQQNADLLLPDGFFYYSVYESSSSPKEQAPWIMQADFTLSAFRHDAMVTEVINGGEKKKIFVDGNCSTPVIYKIHPNEPCDFSINNISVKRAKSTVIINGLKKTIKENSVNKFPDAEITEFPVFKTGYNEIEVVGNVTVEASYYPIYL